MLSEWLLWPVSKTKTKTKTNTASMSKGLSLKSWYSWCCLRPLKYYVSYALMSHELVQRQHLPFYFRQIHHFKCVAITQLSLKIKHFSEIIRLLQCCSILCSPLLVWFSVFSSYSCRSGFCSINQKTLFSNREACLDWEFHSAIFGVICLFCTENQGEPLWRKICLSSIKHSPSSVT